VRAEDARTWENAGSESAKTGTRANLDKSCESPASAWQFGNELDALLECHEVVATAIAELGFSATLVCPTACAGRDIAV
jgi:hypothetical protein